MLLTTGPSLQHPPIFLLMKEILVHSTACFLISEIASDMEMHLLRSSLLQAVVSLYSVSLCLLLVCPHHYEDLCNFFIVSWMEGERFTGEHH